MKQLPDVTYHQFTCDYCSRRPYKLVYACKEHENKCYKNPYRNCPTCKNEGAIDEVMNNGYMGTKNYPCPSCKIAKELGGKSYL